jgi:hypothetical protein
MTTTLTQVALHPTRLAIEAYRRKARRVAVRLAQYVRFCADWHSAAVQLTYLPQSSKDVA